MLGLVGQMCIEHMSRGMALDRTEHIDASKWQCLATGSGVLLHSTDVEFTGLITCCGSCVCVFMKAECLNASVEGGLEWPRHQYKPRPKEGQTQTKLCQPCIADDQ